MKDLKKYEGIIPAFYACYDGEGKINPAAVREMTRWFIDQGVQGLYVGGSSGECIYQSVAERKLVLENVTPTPCPRRCGATKISETVVTPPYQPKQTAAMG